MTKDKKHTIQRNRIGPITHPATMDPHQNRQLFRRTNSRRRHKDVAVQTIAFAHILAIDKLLGNTQEQRQERVVLCLLWRHGPNNSTHEKEKEECY